MKLLLFHSELKKRKYIRRKQPLMQATIPIVSADTFCLFTFVKFPSFIDKNIGFIYKANILVVVEDSRSSSRRRHRFSPSLCFFHIIDFSFSKEWLPSTWSLHLLHSLPYLPHRMAAATPFLCSFVPPQNNGLFSPPPIPLPNPLLYLIRSSFRIHHFAKFVFQALCKFKLQF